MKITYIRLENAAGILVGQDTKIIEIDFSKSKNIITAVQGMNGCGKSTLLSSLIPFSTPMASLDERGSIPYIATGKSGYKEIHYKDGADVIIIKHYFKSNSGGTHNVKSYFQLNGDELNENGNVTSFVSLVEIHMGITPELIRLIRLGTNVNSFVALKPADRKNYIGKLIEAIDLYLKVYKKVNEDLRILKVLMSTNASNLHNCRITDIILEKDKLSELNKQITSNDKEKNKIRLKIDKINALENENNIIDLLDKRKDIESSLHEFNKTEVEINKKSLSKINIDDLIKSRSKAVDKKIDTQSNINALKLNIDSALTRMDQLEIIMKKTINNSDIESLLSLINELKDRIKRTDKSIIKFSKPECTSEIISDIISRLTSFNQIGNMMYTFGNKPISLYLKLHKENRRIETFIREQTKRSISMINDSELRKLISQLFQNDLIITPNCDTQFNECPYYRFSETINEFHNIIDADTYDEETIKYLEIVSNNIDTIMNEVNSLIRLSIPEGFKDIMREKSVLKRMDSKLPLFDLTELQDYLTMLNAYELYQSDLNNLSRCEAQLSVYRASGVDNQLSEIKMLENNISKYKLDIIKYESEMIKNKQELEDIDYNIGLITKYNDGKRYKSIIETNLSNINKILIPLEKSSEEKAELNYQLKSYNNLINSLKLESKNLDNRITEYDKLISESIKLQDKFNKLTVISKAVSTRKGIPLIYMNTYLNRIQKLANQLLSIIYDDTLMLGQFKITADTFEVPYIKNGTVVDDIRYASQSELSLMTMALSFALSYNATGKYNILLLDEIDSGLDESNRASFLKMLHKQMGALECEQVFLISQNIAQIGNLPMDVIKLSETNVSGKLQNIIYE